MSPPARHHIPTAIPSSLATTVVAMIAERSVKRRPSLREATPPRAKMRDAYQWESHTIFLIILYISPINLTQL
jgi:hypothetical protein